MFIAFKIIIGLTLLFLHFKSCFIDDDKIKGKHILFLLAGLIPMIFLSLFIFKILLSFFGENDAIIKEVSMVYMGMTMSVYVNFLFRPAFNKLAGGFFNSIPTSSERQKKFFDETPKRIFNFQRLLFFVGGVIIISGVSIKEIPHTLTPNHNPLDLEEILSKNSNIDQVIAISNHLKHKKDTYGTLDSLTISIVPPEIWTTG